jgi:acetyl esterase
MPALRALAASPARLQRLVAGPPLRLDGQELDVQVQLMLKLLAASPSPPLESLPVDAARSQVVRETKMLAGRPPEVAGVDQVQIPREGDAPIPARLYVPRVSKQSLPLLIYFHGGGFVVGDLETHDNTCRFVAREGDMLVLAVDYRRAPEHTFPAAVEDALTAFGFATEHAHALGAKPSAIAVGGDSSGGNLATVICQQSTLAGIEPPAFQWLLYPITDFVKKRPSYELFGKGFLLTEGQMDWFRSHYLASPDAALDPRASPLHATSLGGLPPAYVATAGFDVLRDEGEEYAQLLRTAGTPVTLRRYSGLTHGFGANLGVGSFGTRALGEAVGALRAAVSAQCS